MSWIYEGFLLGFGVAQWGRESRGAASRAGPRAQSLSVHPYMCAELKPCVRGPARVV